LQRAAQLEDELTQLALQIKRGEAARENLPLIRNEVAALEQERLAFLAQLPRESEVADLIQQLRVGAAEAGVVLESLSQGTVSEPIEGVRPLGFTLAASGTYARTMT